MDTTVVRGDAPPAAVHTLEDFKRNFGLLEAALSKDTVDPHADIAKLWSWVDWIRARHGSQEHNNFFFATALPRLARTLLKRRYPDPPMNTIEVQLVMQYILQVVVDHAPVDLADITGVLTKVFHEAQIMYLLYGHDAVSWDIDALAAAAADAGATAGEGSVSTAASGGAWAEAVQVGDIVAINRSGDVWENCDVVNVSPTATELNVRFADGETKWFSADDPLISPVTSRPLAPPVVAALPSDAEAPWRAELRPGWMADAMDTAKKWYQCLIVGVKEEDGVAKVKVSFVGWSCKYDEWVPRTSPGLARLNSRSYGLRGKGAVAVTEADQELVVDDADDPAGVWAVRRRGARTSALLVENVAFFGQIHGFNTFVTRIGSDPPIPITILRDVLWSISRIASIMTRDCAAYFLPQFVGGAVRVLRAMDDRVLRDVTREILDDIRGSLRRICRRTMSREGTGKLLESLLLDLGLMCFKTPFLNRRLNGLKYIQECVTMARNAKLYPSGLQMVSTPAEGSVLVSYQLVECAVSITTESMAAWLSDHDIVKNIFVTQPHEALMQQSTELLRFMAVEGLLSNELVECIWNVGDTQDVVAHKTVYRVIGDIVADLRPASLGIIVGRVRAVPQAAYTAATLELLRDMCSTNKSPSSADAAEAAVFLLWAAAMDTAECGPVLSRDALQKLSSLFSTDLLRSFSSRFVEIGVECLRTHANVPQALAILTQLVNAEPIETRAAICCKLAADYHIVKLFMADVKVVCDSTGANSKSFSRLEQVSILLDFLQCLLKQSPVKLSVDDVDSLWDALIAGQVPQDQQSRALLWFIAACAAAENAKGPDDFCAMFDEAAISHIFEKRMALPAFTASATPLAFRCVQCYFCFVNARDGHILPNGSSSLAGDFVVRDLNMTGLELIWRVALDAASADASAAASAFITGLQQKLEPGSSLDLGSFRRAQIARSMKLLAEAAGGVAPDFQRIDRCITMVNALLDESEAECAGIPDAQQHGSFDRGAAISLTLMNQARGSATKGCKLSVGAYSNNCVYELRDMISVTIAVPSDKLRIITGGRVLGRSTFHRTLLSMGIFDGSSIVVTGMRVDAATVAVPAAPAAIDEEAGESEPGDAVARANDLPACIIAANVEYFNTLVSLLEGDKLPPAAVATRVWQLLARLPTNYALRVAIEGIARPWNDLLSCGSVVRLLYGLQIVCALLVDPLEPMLKVLAINPPPPAGDGTVSAYECVVDAEARAAWEITLAVRRAWRVRFVQSGGVDHIAFVFSAFAPSTDSAHAFTNASSLECTAVLCGLLRSLVDASTRVLAIDVGLAIAPAATTVAAGTSSVGASSGVIALQTVAFTQALSVDTANHIVSLFRWPMVAALVRVCETVVRVAIDDAIAGIMSSAASVWATSLLLIPETWETFVHDDGGKTCTNFVVNVLAWSRGPTASRAQAAFGQEIKRVASRYSFSGLHAGTAHPHKFFVRSMLHAIPIGGIDGPTSYTCCSEFFAVAATLLEASCGGKCGDNAAGFGSELTRYISHIQEGPIVEQGRGGAVDVVLVGVMTLASVLFSSNTAARQSKGASQLLSYVFQECLFSLPEPKTQGEVLALVRASSQQSAEESVSVVASERRQDPPKCKSQEARAAAFGLLSALCGGNSGLVLQAERLLYELVCDTRMIGSWRYDPKAEEKALTGYVGLRNLGCICYMNALMQQLFMIEPLRYGILSVDRPVSAEECKEDVLYQLQLMFAFLDLSERKAYNPLPWTQAFKDEGGRPTNVLVQQDAHEYFNLLCDRIERGLKGTPQEKLLSNVLAGKFANQMLCQGGCGSVRESPEDFYCITLQLQHQANVADSLESMITGEVIQDFTCDVCGKKAEQSKRVVLQEMSGTLIMHLKRFEFNYETFQRDKVNDRFEFPLVLDMYPYSKEGVAWADAQKSAAAAVTAKAPESSERDSSAAGAVGAEPSVSSERPYNVHPREYYEYELVGAVVHTGTADSGHYYSFIKERAQISRRTDAHGGGASWFEFNDSDVTHFDERNIPAECFGGVRTSMEYSSVARTTVAVESPLVKNAYVLVYERKSLPASRSLGVAADGRGRIPAPIAGKVWEDNKHFLRSCHVFDKHYAQFVVRLASEAAALAEPCGDYDFAGDDSTLFAVRAMTTLVRYGVETLAHALDITPFAPLFETLGPMVERCVPACKAFIGGMCKPESTTLIDVLLKCPRPEVRRAFASLVNRAVAVLARIEEPFMNELDTIAQLPRSTIPSSSSSDDSADEAKTKTPSAASMMPAPVLTPISRALTSRLVEIMISFAMFDDVATFWRHFGSYFQVLLGYAHLGIAQREFLVSKQTTTRIIDLYLGKSSPVAKALENIGGTRRRRPDMFSQAARPDWTTPLDLASILVRSCHNESSLRLGRLPPTAFGDTLFDVQPFDRKAVLAKVFYANALQEGDNPVAVAAMACHWAWEWAEFSDGVNEVFLEGLRLADHDDVPPYFVALGPYVDLDDSLQGARLEELCASDGGIIASIRYFSPTHPRFSFEMIVCLLKLMEEHPHVMQVVRRIEHAFTMFEAFLRVFSSDPANALPVVSASVAATITYTVAEFISQIRSGGTAIVGAAAARAPPEPEKQSLAARARDALDAVARIIASFGGGSLDGNVEMGPPPPPDDMPPDDDVSDQDRSLELPLD